MPTDDPAKLIEAARAMLKQIDETGAALNPHIMIARLADALEAAQERLADSRQVIDHVLGDLQPHSAALLSVARAEAAELREREKELARQAWSLQASSIRDDAWLERAYRLISAAAALAPEPRRGPGEGR